MRNDVLSNIRLEQRQQWQSGRQVEVEEYLKRYPDLGSNEEVVLDLLYGEILLREGAGEVVSVEDYYRRFPRYAESLERQLVVDRLLREEVPEEEVEAWAELATLVLTPATDETPGETPAQPEPGGDDAGPETTPLAPAPAPGRWPTISGYQILGKLGQGSLGVVYEALDLDLQRRVALKMLRSDEDFPELNQSDLFRREAETIARLRHPRIIEIYGFGVHEDRPYFTMELAEGGNLRKKLRRRPMPSRSAAELVEELARAIHVVHQQGIVHRDLKPGNILLTAEGALKIADFGLAKWLESNASIAPSGAIIGTACYMAPEQAGGRTREVGPAADVYALGAILYEALTGRPPFRGATLLEILPQVRFQLPEPPRRLQPDIPLDLEAICLKCLSKSPRDRFTSAAELADRLRSFLDGKPIPERPRRWFEKALRRLRTRPRVTASLGVLLMLVMVAIPVVPRMLPVSARTGAEKTLAQGLPYRFAGTEPLPGPFLAVLDGPAPPQANPVEGCFSLEGLDTVLYELVADPQVTHYKFSVQVRHDQDANSGEVGLFFGHTDLGDMGLPFDQFFTLTFADQGGDLRYNPNQEGQGKGLVQLAGRTYQKTPQGIKKFPGVVLGRVLPFHPAGLIGRAHPWRALAVEVSPTTVKTFWSSDGETLQFITEYPVQKLEDNLGHLQLVNPQLKGLPTQFHPRLGLGLVVSKGRASFRNLKIEPLPDNP